MYSTYRGHTKEELSAIEAANPGHLAQEQAMRQLRAKQAWRNKLARKGETLGTREELLRLAFSGDKHAVWRCDQLFGQSWRRK